MKATWKEIKEIIASTPEELKGTFITAYKETVGYYHPSNANWCYQVHVIPYKESLRTVVTCFGMIK